MKYLATKPGLVIFLLTLIFIMILDVIFKLDNSLLRAIIAAPLAVFLSPRKQKIDTQSGVKKQITWLFLKKPIIID